MRWTTVEWIILAFDIVVVILVCWLLWRKVVNKLDEVEKRHVASSLRGFESKKNREEE